MHAQCPALTGTTAATVTLTESGHNLVISNPVAAIVYIKFDWVAGAAEVSATNFDVMVPASQVLQLNRLMTPTNMRVLCASSTSLGVILW